MVKADKKRKKAKVNINVNRTIAKKKVFPVSLFFLILTITLVLGAVIITEVNVPANNTITSNSSVVFEYNITNDNLNNLTWNWDGTNYSLYDDSLALFYNFDNKSALGENDTHVKDLSKYGNNGTVVGGSNISWTPNGKYGGAFNFLGLSKSYINAGNSTSLNNFNKTISIVAWIYPINIMNVSTNTIVAKDLDSAVVADGFRFAIESQSGSEVLSLRIKGRDGDKVFAPYSFQQNNWYFVSIVMNETDEWLYVNGINLNPTYDGISTTEGMLNGTSNFNNIFLTIGASTVDNIADSGNSRFNGTIDEIMIFNRSLSSSEIQQLYYSSLTKYDSQNWTFQTNQSFNTSSSYINSSVPTKSYNYNLCSSNSTGSENCSTQRTITQTIPNKILTTNFTTKVGNVRSDFYGTGLQSSSHMFSGSIDTDCDGTSETVRNYTWNKETFLNGGNKITYMDANLGSYYSGLYNLDFEWWSNTSVGFKSSGTMGVLGWGMGWGGGRNATIFADSGHTGTYSLGINTSVGTGYLYPYRNLKVNASRTYNISAWVKGQGNGVFECFNNAYGDYHSVSFTMTGTWTQISFICTPSADDSAENIAFEGFSNYENISIDDVAVTEDGVPYVWWQTGSTSGLESQIEWDYQNNITDMIIMAYLPDFLANKSNMTGPSKCLTSMSDTDTSDCMPNDLNIWNNITLDMYQRLDKYRNLSYVQVWNEPYGGSFEDQLVASSAKTDFVILVNNTYQTFKAYNPNIKVVGYRSNNANSTFDRMMWSNLSSEGVFDKGYSIHPYGTYMDGTDEVLSYTQNIYSNCALYGADCEFISIDEWQPNYLSRNTSLGQSNRYKAENIVPYIDILNNYPANVSMMYYHWSDSVSYFNCGSRYAEYPSMWMGVSEMGLDNATANTLYPPYTMEKLTSEYCKVNAEVYTSSNNGFKVVSCKNGADYNIILVNMNLTDSANATITGIPGGITSLKDSNGNTYSVSGGSVSLGILDTPNLLTGNGGFLFLDSDLQSPTITINSPTSQTYTTTSIDFNITLDEEGSWCGYSLNSGSNISMNKQGVIFDFQKTVSITNGNHKVVFTCNDTSNNYNSTNISFTVYKSGGFGGGDEGESNISTCNPLWICDSWSSCSNNLRSKNCIDIKGCSSNENPPLLLSCSLPLPSDRISGCVDFAALNGILARWKLGIFRFDIVDEGVRKWKKSKC